jgi:spore coat protein A, manganese oxidase
MISRRQFLKVGAGAGASLFVSPQWYLPRLTQQPMAPEAILDPLSILKYQDPLIIPPAMPRQGEIPLPGGEMADYYEIAVAQFQQHILPAAMNLPTTVWSYVVPGNADTYNYPAFTIEAQHNKPVRVKWINGLVDGTGQYRPHLLWVDQTLHWANPPGPRDGHGHSQAPYTGPVPIVTHVHGAHTHEESDGYAEAWYLPAANNLPDGYFTEGSYYDEFRAKFAAKWGTDWQPGSALFQYPNDQPATTMWYHDHTLGMTRLNVYAGPAGFYIVRGGPEDLSTGLPGPAPMLGDPAGLSYYEIPIAIQDRAFNQNGSLFYPASRAYFEGIEPDQLRIPFEPDMACDGLTSDIAPIWNPEFFGNTMVVNGRTWPVLNVKARRYRFRFLNGCNSRFVILKMVTGDPELRPAAAALHFWQIGAEGGFLPAPVELETLLMAPAERADIIVDFTGLAAGTELFLINEGPDEPFGGGEPGVDFPFADPSTTGQVMKFVVGPAGGEDTSTDPASLVLPALTPLGPAVRVRRVSLNESDSASVRYIVDDDGNWLLACDHPNAEAFGPSEALLGTVGADGSPVPLGWMAPITETPGLGDTEIWELVNFTMDAHPIHIHEVQFEVVNREVFDPMLPHVGQVRGPEPWETGFKDTVIAYPGEITRVKAKFDLPGLYVWHCHIVEHEDNEMMRPYRIVHRAFLPEVSRNS